MNNRKPIAFVQFVF